MKFIFTLLFLFVFSSINAQVMGDSTYEAWFRNTYIKQFDGDTGIYLPEMKFIDDKGKSRLLTEFKGKVLYVDIWATWCGNCINKFPHQEQLAKRIKTMHLDSSIQLINICTEDSKKEWKQLLAKHRPAGTNLYCQDTTLMTKWKLKDWPTYLIIDKNGKLIGKNVSIPSDFEKIDYMLYAATRNMNPVDAAWINHRQEKSFQENRKHTNDAEGKSYDEWYVLFSTTVEDYRKWFFKYNKINTR